MPRVKKKPKGRKVKGIREREVVHLLTGMDYPFVPPYGRSPGTEYDPEAAWQLNREYLLGYWIQDPGGWEQDYMMEPDPSGPGTRPFGFWRSDAVEPRRIFADDGEAVDWLHEPSAEGARENWHGDRRRFHQGRPWPTAWYPVFEDRQFKTETEYLRRLGLLTAKEIAALR